MNAGGFAVIYRWRVAPEREAQFVEGWVRVTKAIYESCGSHGSRLHKSSDGTWVAYARWPDAATRNRCSHDDTQAEEMMAQAVTEYFPALYLDVTNDLLAEFPILRRSERHELPGGGGSTALPLPTRHDRAQ